MPARVVRGEINSSESLSRVSMEAELTFRALICAVDDYGRFDARPKALKAALFPLRDECTAARIFAWVMELHTEGCVQVYDVDGRAYLQLTGWEKHRGTSKRGQSSKYPEMLAPGESPEIRGNPGDPSESRESGIGSRESRIDNQRARVRLSGSEPRIRSRSPEAAAEQRRLDAEREASNGRPKRVMRPLGELLRGSLPAAVATGRANPPRTQ